MNAARVWNNIRSPTQRSINATGKCQVKVKVKVTLRPTTNRSVSPGLKAHEGLTT
jgi:hypothetical protein